jgi:urease beta subunit
VRAFSTEPKLEYDSSAARGSMLKLRASAAVCFYTPATYAASSAVPITCSGGRSAVG